MNLQEKLSGLKGLVSHSHSKRRFKGDLTLDMISPPLGDFRHTMHVGRGGDVFGDTSFLSNHGGVANRSNGETDSLSNPDNKIGAFFSRALRQIRRGSDNIPREAPKDLSPPPPAISPIIKNAISLPRLDIDMPNGCPTAKALFPGCHSTPEGRKSSYGLESGFVTLPRLSRAERQEASIATPASCSARIHRGSLTDPTDAILSTCAISEPNAATTAYSDSLPSLTSLDTFNFDLGPSLMSEVFSLIDSHLEQEGEVHSHTWEGVEAGSARVLTNEGSEKGSATISYEDSPPSEDCGGCTSPRWQQQEEEEAEEEEEEGASLSVKAPGPTMSSLERVRSEMGMESERFQIATDVLARHYGVSPSKGQSRRAAADSERMMSSQPRKNVSYSYMDDEDEIKV